jgi:hypothetical protein
LPEELFEEELRERISNIYFYTGLHSNTIEGCFRNVFMVPIKHHQNIYNEIVNQNIVSNLLDMF